MTKKQENDLKVVLASIKRHFKFMNLGSAEENGLVSICLNELGFDASRKDGTEKDKADVIVHRCYYNAMVFKMINLAVTEERSAITKAMKREITGMKCSRENCRKDGFCN